MKNGPGSLNRIFRLVWNDQTCSYAPAAECARGRGKRSGTTGTAGVTRATRKRALASLLAGGLAGLTGVHSAQAADPAPQALPQGGRLVQGQAQWQSTGAQLQITQGSAKAAINWQQFNIGSAAQVSIQQPDANSVLLNRVLGADPSAIQGRLHANGQVLLVNPNGIVFGKSARVDVGGIVASTLQISDADFAAGRFVFQREGEPGAVLNQGQIRAARGGYVALLAPEVVNEGIVSAQLGSVALAAGKTITLSLDQGSLLDVKVEPGALAAMVANRELVQAEGGRVYLSAGAAQRLRGRAVAGDAGADTLVGDGASLRLVSNTGRVQAAGGQVQISGGVVDVDGSVQASRIALQADQLNQNGSIDASGASVGGQIRIDAGTVVQTASATLLADGDAAGGSIRVDAGSNLYSSATFSARAANGAGGDIALTADRVRLQAASVDATGGSGGGRVRVGGGFHGGDSDLANALDMGVNGATVLRADALNKGRGGDVVVWSDGSSVFGGSVSARGGAGGGDGGSAEVSGKNTLSYAGTVDLSATSGRAGRLLLDPRNIIIDAQGSSLATLDLSDPTPGAAGTDNFFGIFSRVLANGNVVIAAPKSDTGSLVDTGAVYLFDSRNGALLANLRGASANDQVGMGSAGTNGVTVLANGNYLVLSPNVGTVSGVNVYNSSNAIVQNTTAAAGAITWQSRNGGGSSTVSSSNSLLGSTANTDTANRYTYSGNEVITNNGATTITANDALGSYTTQVLELANGNVVVSNPGWYNGRGAVAWLDGSTGLLANADAGGVLSASNALVGSTPIRSLAPVVAAPSDSSKRIYVTGTGAAPYSYTRDSVSVRTAPPGASGDSVGQTITQLPNGNYVVSSPLWSDSTANYLGAATLGGPQGTVGAVSASNSLVGANSYEYAGSGGVKVVGTSNYVVDSPYWSSTTNAARGRFLENNPNGAVTWVDGSNGFAMGASAAGAVVGTGNSLVGQDGQTLGALSGGSSSTVQASYNSVSSSYSYTQDLSSRVYAGGSVGGAVTTLANGNYLTASQTWTSSRGSVTFGLGASGVAGAVSATNSLVGGAAGDSTGMSLVLLGGSNYAWLTPNADVGAADGGAVTWGSGSSGRSGAISTAASMYGSNASDRVGGGGVLAVGTADGSGLRANYIVLSPNWGNRNSALSTTSYGAVTWVDGSSGLAFGASGSGAAVASGNSLVGSHSGDYVGSYHSGDSRTLNTRSTNGFATVNTDWNASLTASVNVTADGNYAVRSASWDSGKGAVTLGQGASGVAGAVSGSNSLVGGVADQVVTTTRTEVRDSKTVTDTVYELRTTGDHIGLGGMAPTTGGYLVLSPFWSGGKGAATQLNTGSSSGTVSASNSVVGSQADVFSDSTHTTLVTPGDRLGMSVTANWVTPVISTWSGQTTTTFLPAGPYSSVSQYAAYTAYTGIGVTNVVVGYNQSNSLPQANMLRQLTDGNVLLASPGWTNGSTAGAGAVTWINTSTGALTGGGFGAISASNSLVGDIAGDRIGQTLTGAGSTALANGAYLLTNTQWNSNRGAVTWGNASTPASGVISQANSLVGGASGEQVGNSGVMTLSDGNVLVRSTTWGSSQGASQAGAVTWLNAGTGRLATGAAGAVVGATNSLVGSTAADSVGSSTILALANGAYAVSSPNWDNGSVLNVGAVTFGAAGGVVGAVSAANSLVGSIASDSVGSGGLRLLSTTSGSNYLVLSPSWSDTYNNGAGTTGARAGAVTWVNGSNGLAYGTTSVGAAVSARNSLVGDQAERRVGSTVQVLNSGDAVVTTAPTSGVGAFSAVTLLPGATGLAGPLSWRNSMFGLAAAGSSSQLSYALLPAPVSAAETVAARVLATSGYSYLSAYGSRAVALTTLGDSSSLAHGVDAVNAMASEANWAGSYYVSSAPAYAGIGGSSGRLAFSTLAGDDLLITPATLTAMLNAGTSVTLQASNDISVLRDIVVQGGGNGGQLTLEAGRSVHLRGNISTDNGNVVITANQSVAAGVLDSGCTTCVAVIGQAPGTMVNAGSGSIAINLLGSTDKAGNAATKIALSGLSAGQITVANAGLNSASQGQGLRFYSGAVLGNSGTQNIQLLFGGSSTASGGLVLASDTQLLGTGTLTLAAADPSVAVSISADASSGTVLKATEIAAAIAKGPGFDQYVFGRNDQAGATAVAALDFTTAALPGGLSLRGGSGGLAVSGLLRAAVPAQRALSLETGGGALNFASTAAITATGGALQLKTANGGNVTQSSGASLAADRLTLDTGGSVALRNGTNTIGSLSGTAASADIKTSSSLAVAAAGLGLAQGLKLEAAGSSSDLTLNGVVSTTNGNLVLAAGRNFINANATDTGLVAALGRYLVYATNPATSTEGMGSYNKHYAQTYNSASTPSYAGSGNWFLYSTSPTLTISVPSGGGQLAYGDSFTVPGLGYQGLIDGDTSAGAIAGQPAFQLPLYTASGSGHIPVGTYTYSLTGVGAAQSPLGYTLQVVPGAGSFTVAAKTVNVQGLQALNKVYDGTTAAQLQGQASLLAGATAGSDGRLVTGDSVAVSGTASGSFNNRNAGQGKTVAIAGLALAGADAANYVLNTGPTQADITPKALTLQGLSAPATKVYDGLVAASVLGSGTLGSAVAGGSGSPSDGRPYQVDALQLTGSAWAQYDAATVAGATAVGFGGLSLAGAGAGNYTLQFGSQAASITPKALTLTGVSAAAKVYDGSTQATLSGQAQAAGVVNLDQVQIGGTLIGSFANASAGTNKTVTLRGATLGGAAAGNYALALPSLQSTIQPRAIAVTADNQSKVYGDADPGLGWFIGGLGLASTDAASQVLGGSLATASGAAATAGTHAISQGSLGLLNANYTLAFTPGTLTVAKAALNVRADDKAKTYGDADPGLSYTVAASQLKYADSAAAVSGLQLATATGATATAGSHAIGLTGGTADNYQLTLQDGALTVAKAVLNVRADDKAKTYGDADPGLSYTVAAGQLKYADSAAVVSGLQLATATGATATAGSHAIGLTGGTADNYQLTLQDGTLTVAKAALNVRADDKAKTYGDADPGLSYTVAAGQLKYADSAAVVSGLQLATATGAAANAGSHAIGLAGGTADNYQLTLQNGTLTVAKAPLTVRADDKAKTYGDADPGLSYTVAAGQLKYADSAAAVSGLQLATATGAAANAGSHAIGLAGGTADNYQLTLQDGTLTVAKAALNVRADDKAKTYGDADPGLSYTVAASQLKYADSAAVVSGLQLATATGATATAGSHAIGLTGGTADNYQLTLQDGTLTVAKAVLNVRADDKAKLYGDADPGLSYTVAAGQLKYADTAAVVSGLQLATATGAAANAGSHAIGLAGGTADNYQLTLQNGTLTVAKAPLTVRADNQGKKSGDQDPLLTWTADSSELRYGDSASVVQGLLIEAANGRGLPPGQYAIVLKSGEALNYTLSRVDGVYSVSAAPSINAERLSTNAAPVNALVPSAMPSASAPGLSVVQAGARLDELPAGSLSTVAGGVQTVSAAAPAGLSLNMPQPASSVQLSADRTIRFEAAASFVSEGNPELRYAAQLADGRPLPSWLKVDAKTGLLSGTAPGNVAGDLAVAVTATDIQASQASVTLVDLLLMPTENCPPNCGRPTGR